jgi:hypothetical protein
MWQDHCRVNNRLAVSISTAGYTTTTAAHAYDDEHDAMSVVDNHVNHDPSFSWNFGTTNTDDSTSETMVMAALAASIRNMPSSKKTDLAQKALGLLRKSPALAAAPTTAALGIAL